MKKNTGYEINYIENTIIVTKKFLKEAGVIGSAAYTELARVRKDLPDFQIVQREIAKKQGKKTYGKLTYKVMREFMVDQISRKSVSDARDGFLRHCQLKNLAPHTYT